MRIKCNQCGEITNVTRSNKFCPNCGDSFTDEFKAYIRSEIKISNTIWEIAVFVLIAGIVFSLGVVQMQRTYTWEESITNPISDKITYTTTSITIVGSDPAIPITTITHHYEFFLENGHITSLSSVEWAKYSVGDNYTYTITHRDWKPGMENAPTPSWVYIIPIFITLIIIVISATNVQIKRERKLQEFIAIGDTNIGD